MTEACVKTGKGAGETLRGEVPCSGKNNQTEQKRRDGSSPGLAGKMMKSLRRREEGLTLLGPLETRKPPCKYHHIQSHQNLHFRGEKSEVWESPQAAKYTARVEASSTPILCPFVTGSSQLIPSWEHRMVQHRRSSLVSQESLCATLKRKLLDFAPSIF